MVEALYCSCSFPVRSIFCVFLEIDGADITKKRGTKMKKIITICMLLATVICYGLEIHTPTKKEKEIIAAQVWHDVDGFVIVVKSPPPENYFFAFVAEIVAD